MSDIKEEFKREAAKVRLIDMLQSKSRGDRITAAEIVSSTGFEDWRSFGRQVRRWAKAAKFALQPVPNDGWRVRLAHEHVDYEREQSERARRAEKKGLGALLSTPIEELSEEQMRRHQFALVRSSERVRVAEMHAKEAKEQFKVGGERVPLKALAGGKAKP